MGSLRITIYYDYLYHYCANDIHVFFLEKLERLSWPTLTMIKIIQFSFFQNDLSLSLFLLGC